MYISAVHSVAVVELLFGHYTNIQVMFAQLACSELHYSIFVYIIGLKVNLHIGNNSSHHICQTCIRQKVLSH